MQKYRYGFVKAMKRFLNNFLRMGLTGWCLEILFTSLNSIRQKDFRLMGTTSLWMFPIYGSAAFLCPLIRLLKNLPLVIRGLCYMGCIFSAEYVSGKFLMRYKLCPWDYKGCRFQIDRVIRLDYAPNWFLTGLLFEHILTGREKQQSEEA